MLRSLIAAAFVALAHPAFAVDAPILPNPHLTPGAVQSGVTKAALCPHLNKAVVKRNVSASVKREVFQRYGLKGNHTGYCTGKEGCEVDHLISLELGGSNSVENLWPERYPGTWGAHTKDKIENKLHSMICKGQVSLKEAQDLVAHHWIDAYKTYVVVAKKWRP